MEGVSAAQISLVRGVVALLQAYLDREAGIVRGSAGTQRLAEL